jgi:hypothetical protein
VTPEPSGTAGEERISGLALQVAASLLHEDATNPRTEFPDAEIDELAEDIRERGILQPIVVHPADVDFFGGRSSKATYRRGPFSHESDRVPVKEGRAHP